MNTMFGDRVVFVVGAPRSGSTWLQRLVASHPDVRTGQESNLLHYIAPALRKWKRELVFEDGRGGIGMPCYLDQAGFDDVLHEYVRRLMAPMIDGLGPKQLFLEKTPSHAFFVREIAELLPGSRVIHILRDGREVAASLLAAGRSWGHAWAPKKARGAARMWSRHVNAVLDAAPAVDSNRFLEVRYERLTADTVAEVQRIIAFLQLTWREDDIRAAIDRNSPARIAHGEATPIPIGGAFGSRTGSAVREPEGFVRSRGEARTLSPLDRVQIRIFAGRTLKRAGYLG